MRVPPELGVLTRFSEKRGVSAPSPSLDWLRMRQQLMLELLYPRISDSQGLVTGWLLSVADDSPQTFVDELSRSILPLGKVVRQAGLEPAALTFGRALPQESEVVSVRIDSDDAVSRDFFPRIVSLDLEPGQLVSFPRGTIFDFETGRAARSFVAGNTFQIFCGVQRNIFDLGQHGHTPQRADVQFLAIETQDPMWMASCTGGNIANRFPNIYFPESRRNLSHNFPHVFETLVSSTFWSKISAGIVYVLAVGASLVLGLTDDRRRIIDRPRLKILGLWLAPRVALAWSTARGRKRSECS